MHESASQTAGPYIHIGTNPNWVEITGVWDADLGLVMVSPETKGERIHVTGKIYDGDGAPLTDALIEFWQADADGRHNADKTFPGWGRQPTDMRTGAFRFETIRPGPVGPAAPHISIWIVARGINIGLHTRLYFEGDSRNTTDPVLARVPEHRRPTLIARATPGGYVFDIFLQGDRETVFFDI